MGITPHRGVQYQEGIQAGFTLPDPAPLKRAAGAGAGEPLQGTPWRWRSLGKGFNSAPPPRRPGPVPPPAILVVASTPARCCRAGPVCKPVPELNASWPRLIYTELPMGCPAAYVLFFFVGSHLSSLCRACALFSPGLRDLSLVSAHILYYYPPSSY